MFNLLQFYLFHFINVTAVSGFVMPIVPSHDIRLKSCHFLAASKSVKFLEIILCFLKQAVTHASP